MWLQWWIHSGKSYYCWRFEIFWDSRAYYWHILFWTSTPAVNCYISGHVSESQNCGWKRIIVRIV